MIGSVGWLQFVAVVVVVAVVAVAGIAVVVVVAVVAVVVIAVVFAVAVVVCDVTVAVGVSTQMPARKFQLHPLLRMHACCEVMSAQPGARRQAPRLMSQVQDRLVAISLAQLASVVAWPQTSLTSSPHLRRHAFASLINGILLKMEMPQALWQLPEMRSQEAPL